MTRLPRPDGSSMIRFHGQKDRYSERANGERLITLTIYDHCEDAIRELSLAAQGTEYEIILVPTDKPEEFRSETPEETLTRFKKRFEALIGNLAAAKNIDRESYRAQVKTGLKESGLISESTKELTVEQLGKIISEMEDELKGYET